jgi:aryl-alcohol dehydrogenase-like predicted oxidoreductase
MAEIRTLGASGFATPRLVLGGNVFGYTVDGDQAFAILDRFVAAGGTMIDTADVYSSWVEGHVGGESESLIGKWLKRSGRRDDVLIATKVGMLPGEGGKMLEPARIAAAAEASLKRLGIDRIDLYYAHQDDPDTPMEATLAALGRLVEEGKVRALGASNFSAQRLEQALDMAGKMNVPRYEVVQPEYNLMTRDDFEGALQRTCIDRKLGVLPYYGLASGFLTGKYRSTADFGQSLRGGRMDRYLTARGLGVLGTLDTIAAETGATQAQIALAWVAAQPGVTAPIASASNVDQLEELLGAMALELSEDQLARLDAASARSPVAASL